VVTNAGLTVFNFFSVRHYEKRFNAQNWIWTSAELNGFYFFFFIFDCTTEQQHSEYQ
jgi:pectin methylesterase-like acyl-CoA thioesterase